MRLGFICEGKTERKIIESVDFQNFLSNISHTCVSDVIDAEGNGNLLPKNLVPFVERLISKGAEKIIILTDLDKDVCITATKQRVKAAKDHIVIVAVKQIEAWFLSDDICMSSVCRTEFHFDNPEQENDPYETIRRILIQRTNRGIPSKNLLAERMLKNNFSIANAAKHPNCNSAKYLMRRLTELK